MSLLNNKAANIAALRAAIADAREFACEDDCEGFSATRQVLRNGQFEWHVSFSLASFMTHLYDEDMWDMSDDELADEIWSCWDIDWDDVQVERPVGDFSLGSSDFRPRSSESWQS